MCACALALLATGARTPEAAAGRTLVVIYTGDGGGEVESCGCNILAYGGLARRATLVNLLRANYPDAVFVDAGDFFSPGAGEQDRLKDETVAAAYGAFAYDAVNLGEDDFNFGAPFLRTLRDEYALPIISANIFGDDAKPFAPAAKIVPRGGLAVGVVGFLNPEILGTRKRAGAHVRPYNEYLKEAVGELAKKADVIICLAHIGNVEKARAFTRRAPKGVDVVIAGHRGGRTPTAEKIAGRWMVYTRSRNRYVGVLKLAVDGEGNVTDAENAVVPVTKETTPDARTQVIVEEYYAALRELVAEKGLLKPPVEVPAGGFNYVGSARCGTCHAGQSRRWETTPHARALASLSRAKRASDPECIACHVTGYGFRGGFASAEKTPALAGVGCEECHGPGEGHASSPTLKPAPVTEGTCRHCHDAERSPAFDYAKYVSQVKH